MQQVEIELERLVQQETLDLCILFQRSRDRGGFGLNNALRRKIWPKLLNVESYGAPIVFTEGKDHRDKQQSSCDIERSFHSIIVNRNSTLAPNILSNRRLILDRILMTLLTRHPQLYYYQGLNDIFSVIILIMEDESLSYLVCEAVALRFLQDFMQPDFRHVTVLMDLIFTLIETVDPPLFQFMKTCEVQPFFATSWIVTWLTHDIKELHKVARVLDALLCSIPLFSIYLSAAVSLAPPPCPSNTLSPLSLRRL